LLLDEPLSGLDADLKNSIFADLRAWNEANRIPILYVTHDRAEVDALGERVVAMDDGKIIRQGSPREVLDARAISVSRSHQDLKICLRAPLRTSVSRWGHARQSRRLVHRR